MVTSLLRMLAPPMTAPLCSLSKMPRHLHKGARGWGMAAGCGAPFGRAWVVWH